MVPYGLRQRCEDHESWSNLALGIKWTKWIDIDDVGDVLPYKKYFWPTPKNFYCGVKFFLRKNFISVKLFSYGKKFRFVAKNLFFAVQPIRPWAKPVALLSRDGLAKFLLRKNFARTSQKYIYYIYIFSPAGNPWPPLSIKNRRFFKNCQNFWQFIELPKILVMTKIF